MDNTLRNKAKEKYNNKKLLSWVMSVLTCLLIALLYCLDFVDFGIGLIITPLVVLPILFGMHMTNGSFDIEQELSLGNQAKYTGLYFKPPFNTSFRFWFSVLRCFVLLIGLFLILEIPASIALEQNYPELVDQILNAYSSGDSDALINLVESLENSGAINMVVSICAIPPIIVSIYAFYFFTIKNSIGVYFRMGFLKPVPGQFVNNVYSVFLKQNRKQFNKDFYSLNWPMFVLGFVGMVVGAIIPFITNMNILYSVTFAVLGLILFTTGFLPFYFANMEVLSEKYTPLFHNANNEYVLKAMNKFSKDKSIDKDDLDKINDLIKKLEEEKQKEDNGNKKDPGGSN